MFLCQRINKHALNGNLSHKGCHELSRDDHMIEYVTYVVLGFSTTNIFASVAYENPMNTADHCCIKVSEEPNDR